MRILITGGAGFIGSALVRHLIAATTHHAIVVDKLTYAGNLEALADVADSERYTFCKVEVCDRPALVDVFELHQPDAVMHIAAETHVDRSIDGPAPFIQSNLVGTWTLLETACDYWRALDERRAENFRLHHVSTDEVYGELACDAAPVDEQARYVPSSPYAASKAGADHLVRAWHRTYGLPVVISNSTNNYGPFQYPEKLIPVVISRALRGESIPVYGDGEQERDWLHVDDHVRALVAVLTRGRIGETYNIGASCPQRNIDLVRAVCTLLDELQPCESGVSYAELITRVDDRPGHDRRYAVDTRKLEQELGWCVQESFENGLRNTLSWYLEHWG